MLTPEVVRRVEELLKLRDRDRRISYRCIARRLQLSERTVSVIAKGQHAYQRSGRQHKEPKPRSPDRQQHEKPQPRPPSKRSFSDRGAYIPSQEEIAEACDRMRSTRRRRWRFPVVSVTLFDVA